jgi:hypothetical protein
MNKAYMVFDEWTIKRKDPFIAAAAAAAEEGTSISPSSSGRRYSTSMRAAANGATGKVSSGSTRICAACVSSPTVGCSCGRFRTSRPHAEKKESTAASALNSKPRESFAGSRGVNEDDDRVSRSRCHACGEELALFFCDDYPD